MVPRCPKHTLLIASTFFPDIDLMKKVFALVEATTFWLTSHSIIVQIVSLYLD